MLAPLSMMDVEYHLWRDGIPYAKRLTDEMGYDEFNETRLMSLFTRYVSFPLHFPSFFFLVLLHIVILVDAYFLQRAQQ